MLDRHPQDESTPDADLIARTAAGDRRAFECLVERHAAAVLRLATVVTDDPEALAIAAERRDTLTWALQTLSIIDREVLILRDVEGLNGPEAAEVLGITGRALKSRLHRARLRLAGALRASAEIEFIDEGGG